MAEWLTMTPKQLAKVERDLAACCADDAAGDLTILCDMWEEEARAQRARAEEAERLAYIGEHHHPDLTWKARVPELVSDLRTAESEVARLREVNGKLVALCDDLLHAIGGVTLYGGPLGFVAAYRAALAALTQEAPDA